MGNATQEEQYALADQYIARINAENYKKHQMAVEKARQANQSRFNPVQLRMIEEHRQQQQHQQQHHQQQQQHQQQQHQQQVGACPLPLAGIKPATLPGNQRLSCLKL